MKLNVSLFFVLLLISIPCFSQTSETIYAHLDKEIYLPGEQMWFKAYVLENGKPGLSSTTLYAGLYDMNGKLLQEKRYPLMLGSAAGNFQISDSIPTAGLQLRLFTKSMIRADSNNAYQRSLAVYNKKLMAGPETTATKEIVMEAFPEGGQLVAGVINHMLYAASNAPANLVAALTDQQGNFVDSIYFDALGSARSQFTPAAQKNYQLQWMEGNTLKTVALPIIAAAGAVMHTEIGGDKLYYFISKNNDIPRFNTLSLLAESGLDTLFQQSVSFKTSNQFMSSIPLDSLPGGGFWLSLKDANNNTLQRKRLLVTKKNTQPIVNIIENKPGEKGKKVIEIRITDTTMSSFSAAVIDDKFYFPNHQSSIADGLLINKTGATLYNASSNESQKDMLLTRYPASTLSVRPAEIENYLSVKISSGDKDLPPNSTLTMIVNSAATGKEFLTVPSADSRNFRRDGLVFYDSSKIYYQVNGRKDLSSSLTLQYEKFLRQPAAITAAPAVGFFANAASIASDVQERFENNIAANTRRFNDEQTMTTVIAKSKYVNPVTKRLLELEDKYVTGMAKGMARGTQLNVIDDPNAAYSDPFNYIVYRSSGLAIDGRFGARSIVSLRTADREPLLVFIDNVPTDYLQLENLQMSQVAYIKVIPGLVITSAGNSIAGVIYVFRKLGDEDKTSTGMKWQMLQGYNVTEEFKMPDYSQKGNQTTTDYRTTLYWNPNIFTDKNNRTIRIEYYNND
ncbi:MAG: hypothetical protein EOO13_15990, partial [Chitinophagaceae bacterium]